MSTPLLERVELEPIGAVRATAIWLHGLGDTGHGWSTIAPELGVADELGLRFVFPHAPALRVTLNGGVSMPAWYDIRRLDARYHEDEDEAGIRMSSARVSDLIAREVERGVPEERIILAGFSQGGAIALHAGLRHPRRLGGILALSTCLPLPARVAAERSEANAAVPIWMAHGTQDPVIPLAAAKASRVWLEEIGYRVDWHEYPMPHSACQEEIRDVATWLRGLLA